MRADEICREALLHIAISLKLDIPSSLGNAFSMNIF